jgi:hypothetical protein
MAPVLAPLFLVMTLGGAADVAGLDATCRAVEVAGHARRQTATRVFAETSGAVLPRARQGQWRELETEAALETLSKSEHAPNTEAVVRTTPKGTLVSMYFQDASGDWAHVVDYCFRPAGSLARMRGTFNSFKAAAPAPGIRRRRTTYLDAQGAVVRTRARVFDLDSDRARPGAQFVDEADPLYASIRALPFADSLEPPAGVTADPNGVVAVVRERLPSLKACYEQALKKTPAAAGKVVARWSIGLTGQVTAFSWQSDELGSPVFSACARRTIESWRFAPVKGEPVAVSFPFVFAGSSAAVAIAPSPAQTD